MGLIEFQRRFPTEEACEEHLFKVRWPEGFICPNCQSMRFYKVQTRGLYQCTSCRRQTSVTAGTVIHKSKMPLQIWFWAIYLCVTDKRGRSALSLSRHVGVSYPTAWLMLHKIRPAMAARDASYKLSGLVEIDDAYFGGQTQREPGSGKGHGRGTDKAKVVVAVSMANGKPAYVRMKVIDQMSTRELTGFATECVKPGAEIVTDGLAAYTKLSELGYNHSPKVFKKEGPEFLKWVHTIISNAKAYIDGTYHGLDKVHLQSYLDEFCYRFNRRNRSKELFSRLLAACVDGPITTYAELTL